MDNLDAVNPMVADNSTPPADTTTVTPPADTTVVTPPTKVETPLPTPNFPDNWRDLIASGDVKELERLKRFTTPNDIYKSFRNLENKLSSGQYKQALAADATAEDIANWRKANGIPEKADGYFEHIPEGMVLGEEDKNALELFAAKLHEKNATPEIFNTVMQTALDLIELNQQESVDAQIALKEQNRHKLYQHWGPAEYKVNINAIANVLSGMPESLRNRFEGATLADGTLMFNDFEAMSWWAQYVRENNPALAITPNGGGDVLQSIEQQLNENRMLMRQPSVWQSKENAERRSQHTKLLEQFDALKRKRG